jgi:hypothetical protein
MGRKPQRQFSLCRISTEVLTWMVFYPSLHVQGEELMQKSFSNKQCILPKTENSEWLTDKSRI